MLASFPDQQVTGVAVSKSGRLFASFPNWSSGHTLSVVEMVRGKAVPFPDRRWNVNAGEAGNRFVCVQSVFIDETDTLWVLDSGAPQMEKIVPGGPKLLKVNLASNRVEQIYRFGDEIAPEGSYLNDVRIDHASETAFLTDSGLGAIIALDLKTGSARRLLADHPSTKGNGRFRLVIKTRPVIDAKTGESPVINVDGIAYDAKSGYLYYHALTSNTLYRIKGADLRNLMLSPASLASKVEKVMDTPAPDGMLAGADGMIYLTDIENNAIRRYDPASGALTLVLENVWLEWPDSLSWMPDGSLAVSISQIEKMPRFSGGKGVRSRPYRIFKVPVR